MKVIKQNSTERGGGSFLPCYCLENEIMTDTLLPLKIIREITAEISLPDEGVSQWEIKWMI